MATKLKVVKLWDGAGEISLPECMIDASDIRPVPDNQEVHALQYVAPCDWLSSNAYPLMPVPVSPCQASKTIS